MLGPLSPPPVRFCLLVNDSTGPPLFNERTFLMNPKKDIIYA